MRTGKPNAGNRVEEVKMLPLVGSFAEDKDVARDIRLNKIIPALDNKQGVTLDFTGIETATQSFIHALISDLFRKYGNEVLDMISFKGCDEFVRKIVNIVCEYMQDGE